VTNPVARSLRRRRLGVLLRRLRKDAGLSGEALAGTLGVSQSHLSRVELGDTAASMDLVERWTRECHASAGDRSEVAELAASVTTEFVTWRAALASGLVARQREAAEAEAAATTLSDWMPLLIPGLLQTVGYAHHLVASGNPDRLDVADAVAARIQRQSVLYDRSKSLRWVIGEPALRWRIGPPDVMAAQLDRLSVLVVEPHLDLRILPLSNTAPVWHDHAFSIEADRVDGKPDLVNLELLTGEVNVTEPGEVAEYKKAYERLAELALSGAEAVAFIRQVMAEMRT
jgi:transcriptional regulator with XRE-family HTH domain